MGKADELNAPTCRNCGSDEIHSIERGIEWRYATWVFNPGEPERQVPGGIVDAIPRGWYVSDMQDRVGDDSWETIGIACGGCNTEVLFEEGGKSTDLITTRAAYNRTHPVRRWRVEVVQRPGSKEMPRRHKIVTGRDRREAEANGHIAAQRMAGNWMLDYLPKVEPYGAAA